MKKTLISTAILLSCKLALAQTPYVKYSFEGNLNEAAGCIASEVLTQNGTAPNAFGYVAGPVVGSTNFGQAIHITPTTANTTYFDMGELYDFPQKTICFWFKPDNNTSSSTSWIYMSEALSNTMLNSETYFNLTTGNSGNCLFSNGPQYTTAYVANQWNFAAIVRNPAVSGVTTLQYYLNCQLVATATTTTDVTSTPASGEAFSGKARLFNMGENDSYYSPAPKYQYLGAMDELAIYNSALTASQLSTIMGGAPTPVISGNASVCPGSSTVLSVSPSGSPYTTNWTVAGNNTVISTAASITESPIANTTYDVTVTNANGCSATVGQLVSMKPHDTPVIIGTTSICAGGSTTLNSNYANNANYHINTWSTGGTSLGSSNSITESPTSNTTYDLTTTYVPSGCAVTVSQLVTVSALPTPVISGNASVCPGSSTVLSVSPSGSPYTTNWTVAGNNTVISTAASITESPIANTTYDVTVTNANGCSATVGQLVSMKPHDTPVIIGTTSICAGGSTTLNSNYANNANYHINTWSTGGTSLGSSNSITESPTSNTTYDLTTTYVPSGCAVTVSQLVTVLATPTLAITSPTICAGTSYTLCSGYSSPYTTSWYIQTDNGIGKPFSTLPCVTVTPTVTTTYYVTVNGADGCSANEAITVTVLTNIPSFNLADNTALSGYALIYAIANNGATTSSPGYGYEYILEELNGSVTNWIQSNNPLSWWSLPAATYFNGINNTPTDYAVGSTNPMTNLSSTTQGQFKYGNTYRVTLGSWNNACPWAQSSQIITLSLTGGREAGQSIIKSDYSAPNFSFLQNQQAATTGINSLVNDDDAALQLSVYPNPNNGNFIIETHVTEPQLLEVYDLSGRLVLSQNVIGTTSINAVNLADGMYNIKISNNNNIVNKRIIISK